MTTNSGPYETPEISSSGGILETTITTATTLIAPIQIAPGFFINNGETYNGHIPGPTLRLNVDDTVIVRLVNNLPYPTGIHWHGIELANTADGTPVTQRGIPGGPGAPGSAQAGGTYLYKFSVPRPGIYWYHPHHFHSTNRVFRGLYGMIVVTDPNEATLVTNGVLPDAAATLPMVLSDMTVCPAPTMTDAPTYAGTDPWVGGSPLPPQAGPTPIQLCYLDPQTDDPDNPAAPVPVYGAGDIPNIQREKPSGPGSMARTNEGQTVLTNGVIVGGRTGTPDAPGALAAGAFTHPVQPGQGLRLQIVNCATSRYFRLRLTRDDLAPAADNQVELVRVGGEGGLLNNAVVEGGQIGPSNFDTKYGSGEILLPPATRADVVIAVPSDASGTMTLWTQDYERTGGGFSNIPTVPVMHLEVSGSVVSPPYAIADGTAILASPLLASDPNAQVTPLGPTTGSLLDPTTFNPSKTGSAPATITLATGPSIDSVQGGFPGSPYPLKSKISTSRWALEGSIVQMTVTNTTGAHHPFHLHGFSFQPISLTPGATAPAGSQPFTWPYTEFRDTVDIPNGYVLTYKVHLEDTRPLLDNTTTGGSLGRWLFHCHIFHHAHGGMISELVVSEANGGERPYVDVNGSWAYTPPGGTAIRTGTARHPDGDSVALDAHLEDGTPFGSVTSSGSNWSWSLNSTGMSNDFHYVYITGTSAGLRKDQAVFRVQIGGFDEGADNGDPHLHTVDGQRYDFQAVGEFTLLRDRDGMEVQTRQTPVPSQNPITDSYSGLTACVSINTAVAIRVGDHRIAYQQGAEQGSLEFFVDGKRARLTTRGLDLGGHRVSAFDADGAVGLRVDYAHHAVVQVTPKFWNSHSVHYMNVSISHTHGDEGLMGPIPRGSWLPRLQSGETLGPRPLHLQDRWKDLYQTFANSWRVTDLTSLLVYAPGTSTETFTDRDWPSATPPCTLKPQFGFPGAPVLEGMPVAQAEQICQVITDVGLRQDCVFDVATTGDQIFAEGYQFAEELRLKSTAVQLVADPAPAERGEVVKISATVTALGSGRPTPPGIVTFMIDGIAQGESVALDGDGKAHMTTNGLTVGDHRIEASYEALGNPPDFHPSTSPATLLTVQEKDVDDEDGTDSDNRDGPSNMGLKHPVFVVLLLIILILLLIAIFT